MNVLSRSSALVGICLALSATLSAQWPDHRKAAAPRTADGKVDLNAPAPKTADGKPDLYRRPFPPEQRSAAMVLRLLRRPLGG